MRAIEFSAEVEKDNVIHLPAHFAKLLKDGKKVKIILLFEEDENDWETLSAQQFLEGYSKEDSVYDKM